MSNDVIEGLSAVGDLNDTWGESNLPERQSPLYVVEPLPRPARRGRFVVSGTVAALALVAVMATALIVNGDRGVAPDPQPPAVPSAEAEGAVAERLSGDLPDGTSWTLDVPADSNEVCYQIESSFGCGIAPTATMISGTGRYPVFYGLLDLGLIPDGIDHTDGEPLTRTVTGVDVELTNGSVISAEHVGQRMWATLLPRGVTTWAVITYHWDDGSSTRMSFEEFQENVAVEHLTEEEREAAEAEGRRQAERMRQMAEDRLRD